MPVRSARFTSGLAAKVRKPCSAVRTCAKRQEVRLVTEGQPFILQERATVGSASNCDIRLRGEGVEARHAEIYRQGTRVLCKPLVGDEFDLRASTRTWVMPDTELRAGVNYLLSPGTQLAFGACGRNILQVEFDEGKDDNAFTKLMFEQMLASADPNVQERAKGE